MIIERRNSFELLIGIGCIAVALVFIGQGIMGNAPLLICIFCLPHLSLGVWITLNFASLHITMDRRSDTMVIRWKSTLRETKKTVSLSDIASLKLHHRISYTNGWFLRYRDGSEKPVITLVGRGVGLQIIQLNKTKTKVNRWIAQAAQDIATP